MVYLNDDFDGIALNSLLLWPELIVLKFFFSFLSELTFLPFPHSFRSFAGGATQFYDKKNVPTFNVVPKKGTAIVFFQV
jgi:hypothetical protein